MKSRTKKKRSMEEEKQEDNEDNEKQNTEEEDEEEMKKKAKETTRKAISRKEKERDKAKITLQMNKSQCVDIHSGARYTNTGYTPRGPNPLQRRG